ncbi:MAG: alpha/beta hydrolase [Thermoanaerobaculia bacterium]|nr:alpha/beta hydrolase [Thermoanaerobaculia bacterium]
MRRPIDRTVGLFSTCAVLVLGGALLGEQIIEGGGWEQAFAPSSAGGSIAYYEVPGAPPTVPLVVVSGGPGSDHRYMHAGGAFEALARRRRVVMFDQRATGASSPAPAEPTIDQWLADIDAVRRALGVETIDLLGHSFGGYLAMSYAVEQGERVRSLVLVDSAAPDLEENVQLLAEIYPERAEEWAEVRAGLSERFPAEAIALFFSMEFVDPAWLERYLEHVSGLTYDIGVNNALRRDMERRALADRVGEIVQPVLVLHGRHDAVLAPVTSWKIHRELTDSRFQVIEQSGHMPFVERPEEFVAAVAAFLAQIDAVRAE